MPERRLRLFTTFMIYVMVVAHCLCSQIELVLVILVVRGEYGTVVVTVILLFYGPERAVKPLVVGKEDVMTTLVWLSAWVL